MSASLQLLKGCDHRFECVLHNGPRLAHVEAHPALAGPPGGRTVVHNPTGEKTSALIPKVGLSWTGLRLTGLA